MAYVQNRKPSFLKKATRKVCLPLAKIKSMSQAERQKVINAKKAAANAMRGGKKGDKSKTDKGEEDFTEKKGSKSETHEGDDFEEK